MASVPGVLKPLREQLRDLIGQASHLDGVLSEARALPPAVADLALAEVRWLNRQLQEVTQRVESATGWKG
ncbi:MAG TPA: hypothetical protein VJ739_16605 [Gemmataceae bacterium]|nr:hypothetical protein [Gemmataceae bacterium]